MDGLLVFDQRTDVIYAHFDAPMHRHIHRLAVRQGLVEDAAHDPDVPLDANMLVQLFSPLIGSQFFMFSQFDNSYASLECDGHMNFVFEEFLGYLLLQLGDRSVKQLQRSAVISLALMKRVCGPDLNLLKSHPNKRDLVTALIEHWHRLVAVDQSVLVEGVERLLVNSDLKAMAHRTLEAVTENLKQDPHSQRSHALLFVRNTLLSVYSSKQAQELAANDVLFLSLFQQCRLTSDDDDRAPPASPDQVASASRTHLLLLQGQISGPFAGCVPHIVHTVRLQNDAVLMLLIEYGSLPVASGLFDTFYALHNARVLQLQNDVEALRPAFDKLDGYVKQELNALRRAKLAGHDVETAVRRFSTRWDVLRKKYADLFRGNGGGNGSEQTMAIESNFPAFLDALKELFRLTCVDCPILEHGLQRVREIATVVNAQLLGHGALLRDRQAQRAVMAAYLGEFPGLVHFVHVDRWTGRVIAPHVPDGPEDGSALLLVRPRIWSMVEFARDKLQLGHTSFMWKDATFSYSYVLWFEDTSGNALTPAVRPSTFAMRTVRAQIVPPGILAGEYYQWLVDACFPRTPSLVVGGSSGCGTKVRCYELFCVHLGLATASCVLEHSRRLAATIMEVAVLPGPDGLNGL